VITSLSCPGEDILRLLGTDALDEASFAAVEEHVEVCPACQAIVERLARRRTDLRLVLPGSERWPCIPGFAIQCELGRGAMGVVYQAVRTGGLDRPVALKVLPSAAGGESPVVRRRWLREARAVSSARHPNIVTLYDYGEADAWFYLVLEYIPGGTLKQRLDNPLPARMAAGLVETISRAVGCFHDRGLYHLDLKPSNILLDGAEKDAPWDQVIPKVSDFGLALSNGDAGASETSLTGFRGTPSYMAPEQAAPSSTGVGAAADIHALGAILYELLTGRPPVQGTSTLETLDQVRSQGRVPPRRLNPKIPRDLETIALKCLEKSPSRRYASAEALADDLRCWLDGKPISARPVSALERTSRWCRRRPVIAALTAALTLVLSTSFVIVVLLWRHAEAQRRRAEDDLHFAALMVRQISRFSLPGSAQSLVLTRDNIVAVLQRTRHHILSMRRQRPDDVTTYHQLADVDICLATHFEFQGKSDERRFALTECLENAERALQLHPQDLTAIQFRFIACMMLGSVADKQGKREESLDHLERAVAHGEECMRLDPSPALATKVAECRWSLAQMHRRQGNDAKARSLILTNRRMLDDIPEADRTPIVAIWRTLVRLDLHQFQAGSSSAPGSRPDEGAPLSRLAASEADELSAESWAALVARCLSSGPSAIDLTSNDLCMFMDHLSERMAWQRRLGRIDEARRAAERMHALARLLVARYPDQGVAHFALCASFQQIAKNAWKTDDHDAVVRNWKLAIDEARRALVLNPQCARAGFEVADLQKRLDLLLASKPAPRD
jgi:eukaryotic-like serine/threonine-protein kinase